MNIKNKYFIFFALIVLFMIGSCSKQTLTIEKLLNEMLCRDRLAVFPSLLYT